jgi:hypothetical protein
MMESPREREARFHKYGTIPIYALIGGLALLTIASVWLGREILDRELWGLVVLILLVYLAFFLWRSRDFFTDVPKELRGQDLCPWDMAFVREARELKDVLARFPALSIIREKGANRLWASSSTGPRGTWSLWIETREDEVVGYQRYFQHAYTVRLDWVEHRGSRKSKFIE